MATQEPAELGLEKGKNSSLGEHFRLIPTSVLATGVLCMGQALVPEVK